VLYHLDLADAPIAPPRPIEVAYAPGYPIARTIQFAHLQGSLSHPDRLRLPKAASPQLKRSLRLALLTDCAPFVCEQSESQLIEPRAINDGFELALQGSLINPTLGLVIEDGRKVAG